MDIAQGRWHAFRQRRKKLCVPSGGQAAHANTVPGSGVVVQGSGGRIGNITNSVIVIIVQNGQPVQVPTVSPYDWVLTCPLLPEDVDLEGVTTLKIDAAPFPHDAESSAWRCDISGSPNVALDACPAEQADLHVSGAPISGSMPSSGALYSSSSPFASSDDCDSSSSDSSSADC